MPTNNKLSRREWLLRAAKTAAAYPIFNMGITAMSCGGGSRTPTTATAAPSKAYAGTNDQLMDDIQRAAFDFFWTEASPATGQIRDRAPAAGGGTNTFGSIASTGYGLGALCIGDKRGYGDLAQIKARVTTTLDFLANKMPNEHGFYYHFVDINTGVRFNNQIELSDIDSAILFCGALFARQYYQNDSQIQSLATTILNRADWKWFLNGKTMYSMQWTPEKGFDPGSWDHYCELMMMYLLGLGSPTHPIPAASWTAWARPPISYQGYNFIYGDSPLFVHQFSHAWFDFRNKTDVLGINYFQNSIDATKAHKLFCLSLKSQFPDYADNLWGITASDYAKGYTAWGGPPAKGPIDGTVVPCACAGSLPFDFTDCIAVLRNIRSTYPKAWQRYGFVDAFNPLTGWYDTDVIGIDQGISMLMAENQRSGMVWQVFNTAPEVQAGMKAAWFK